MPIGSILLNLACSDRIDGAFALGKVVNLIGDSSSGKTLLALSMFAEMTKLSEFDAHRFIYDDAECACEFNIEKLFGRRVAERIEPPFKDEEGNWVPSETVESFYANVQDAIDDSRPFIYVLDSFDSVTSVDERERGKKLHKAVRNDQEMPGSYKVEKPRMLSEILRNIVRGVKNIQSLVVIISQTRDNIGGLGGKTRSGGKALKFYSSHEIWLAVKKDVKSRDRIIGVDIKARVTKNKLTGKYRTVDFRLYYDYGVDDLRSCIDFLIAENDGVRVNMNKRTLEIPSMGLRGEIDSVIREIENSNRENELYQLVQNTWNEIEESLKLNRKEKFHE